MIIYLKLLLTLAVAFALIKTFIFRRESKVFLMIITTGMAAGVIAALFPYKTVQLTGIGIYFVFVALAFVYGFTANHLKLSARLILCLMAAPIFMYWLWRLNHWHGNELLLPVFVLLVGLYGLFTRAKLKNESGILIMLAADAIAIILEHWMKSH
ncbi:MAG: hypothetical protein HOO86_13200 [Bacteroidales bacterium]|nr:hypothetical protein [Bacteroidales bacterium]